MTFTITGYKNTKRVEFELVPTDGSFNFSVCSMEAMTLAKALKAKGFEVFNNGIKVFVAVDEFQREEEFLAEAGTEFKTEFWIKAEKLVPAGLKNVKTRGPMTPKQEKEFWS